MAYKTNIIDDTFSMKMIDTYRSVQGEQETKNKLIEPFFEKLGYDIDCIDDIHTEMVCDFGIKNEKIDYVLCIAGIPKILVEAKDWKISLNTNNINQLNRYFAASDCKLAILTNGLEYWFFSDFEKENIMDPYPFHKMNVLALKDSDNEILTAICKTQQCSYDINQFVVEKKARKLYYNKEKIAEIIALNYFGDIKSYDAVYNGIRKATF